MKRIFRPFLLFFILFSCSEDSSTNEPEIVDFEIYNLSQLQQDLENLNSITLANYMSGSSEPIFRYEDDALEYLAEKINEEQMDKFLFVGYTNSQGNADTNLQLSINRAKVVRSIFIENYSLDELQIQYIGEGESNPIDTNETSEGRSNNSRVELRF